MCIYIGIEDLVANALIELIEHDDKNEVLFSDLDKYGAKVVQILKEEEKEAILILSNDKTLEFLHDYSAYFEVFTSESGEGIKLKENVSIMKLWEKFRGYLAVDVMKVFMNQVCIKELGIHIGA